MSPFSWHFAFHYMTAELYLFTEGTNMRGTGIIASKFVIFGLHSITLCWGFSASEFLLRASVLLRNFDQILLISDNDLQDTGKLRNLKGQ